MASFKHTIRYGRQILLPELGQAGQARLQASRVLVVGAGGLGCPALTYLAAAGLGQLIIADGDKVEESNLHRQPLYRLEDLGQNKAEAAAAALRRINPLVSVLPRPFNLDRSNICTELGQIDAVIDGSDNFAAKYLLNDACVELNKPLVFGAVFRFDGQAAIFNAELEKGGRGPTYRCLFPEPPPPGLVSNCADAGVIGFLPGIIGTIQAAETIKLLAGIGAPLVGRMLLLDALRMEFTEIALQRNDKVAAETRLRPAKYYSAIAGCCASANQFIDPAELTRLLELSQPVKLIDVREPEEKTGFDLGGELIPAGLLEQNLLRIPRDQTVVFYCRSGVRSLSAVQHLTNDFGFSNLRSLRGGLNGWPEHRSSPRDQAE